MGGSLERRLARRRELLRRQERRRRLVLLLSVLGVALVGITIWSTFGSESTPGTPVEADAQDARAGSGQLNLKSEGSDLSTGQVKKMIAAGWEIGSHTITHPDLRAVSPEQLERELEGSKRQLEQDLGIEIFNFCYPAGRYNREVVAAVEAAGYRGATTVNPGLGRRDMPFELNRIRINRGDGASVLATKLAAAGV